MMQPNAKTTGSKAIPAAGAARQAKEAEVAPLREAMQKKLEQAGGKKSTTPAAKKAK